MRCYNCNNELSNSEFCSNCGKDNNIVNDLYELSSICYNDALKELAHNRLSSAIELLNKSVQINSRNIEALNLLGLCYFQKGQFSLAFTNWIYSINEKDYNNPAHEYLNEIDSSGYINKIKISVEGYNKSIDFINDNNEKFAIMQLKKVVKLIPNFFDATLLLSVLLIQEREYREAYKILKNILYIDSSNTEALRYKSEIEKHILKESNYPEKSKDNYKVSEKGMNSISIGNRVLSIIIGFIIGVCFILIIAYPAIKNNQTSTTKDIFVDKNREILDMKAKIDEIQKERDELKTKVSELKSINEKNAKDNKNIIDAIYNSAKQRYDSNDFVGAKNDALSAINFGGRSSDLYILYLRTIIFTDGVNATENIIKEIEEVFKEDKETIQKARDIISATKEINNG